MIITLRAEVRSDRLSAEVARGDAMAPYGEHCDVLIVRGSFAGLVAARSAAMRGARLPPLLISSFEDYVRKRKTRQKEQGMDDRPDNRGRGWRNNWGLILATVAALALFGAVVAYKFTGDFTGMATLGTSGRQQPR